MFEKIWKIMEDNIKYTIESLSFSILFTFIPVLSFSFISLLFFIIFLYSIDWKGVGIHVRYRAFPGPTIRYIFSHLPGVNAWKVLKDTDIRNSKLHSKSHQKFHSFLLFLSFIFLSLLLRYFWWDLYWSYCDIQACRMPSPTVNIRKHIRPMIQ